MDTTKYFDIIAKGRLLDVTATLERPNNNVNYGSGDFIGNSTDLATISPMTFALPEWATGLSGYAKRLIGYRSSTNLSPDVSIYMFTAPIYMNIVDNSPWKWYATLDGAKYIGKFDAMSWTSTSSGCYGFNLPTNPLYFSNLQDNALYGYAVTALSYTSPVAKENFQFKIQIVLML